MPSLLLALWTVLNIFVLVTSRNYDRVPRNDECGGVVTQGNWNAGYPGSSVLEALDLAARKFKAWVFPWPSPRGSPLSSPSHSRSLAAIAWYLSAATGSQYSISNMKTGQYLGGTVDQVRAISSIFWWTLLPDGTKYAISSNDMAIATQTQREGVERLTMERMSPARWQWFLVPIATPETYGPYLIKNKKSQKYLTLSKGSPDEGTPVKALKGTPERNADPAFKWRVIQTSDEENFVRIQNVASGTYLEKREGAVVNSGPISGRVNAVHGWVVKPAPGEPGARIIQLEETEYVVELGSGAGGTDIVISHLAPGKSRQLWYFDFAKD